MNDKALIPHQPRPIARGRRPRSELSKAVSRIEYIEEYDYTSLVEAASHPEHKLLMRLLWETGLRISEALNLSYSAIHPDGIMVMNGKGGKQRFVPCQARVLGEMFRYRETHGSARIFNKLKTESGALLMLRRYAKKAGIEKRIYPHLFRHSWAINVLRQTGNPFVLQDMGGWSDMETIKIYMRLAKEEPKQAIQRMSFPEV